MNCCLFQMKYIFYQSTRLERHRCLNSTVNFLESVMMRGVLVVTGGWSTEIHQVQSQHRHLPGYFRASRFLLLRGFMEILISFSGMKLSICPQCQNDYQMFFLTILLLLLCLIGQPAHLTWTTERMCGVYSHS